MRIPSLRKFFAEAGASKSESLSEAKLFPLIDALTVRRDRAFIKERYRNERFADGTPVKFPEPELHERRYDLDRAHPGLVQAIYDGIDGLTMARYRPSAYRVDKQGESASEEALAGLMQSQLLKRFESSWYAALQTVRRMRDASEVLLRVITERGAVPPPEVIRDLVGEFGEDDTFLSADLIDEALAGSEAGISADSFKDDFLTDLKKDRDALASMLSQLESLKDVPDPKLHALRGVMEATPSQKVAVFTAFQDTAVYLKEQIESQPDVLGDRKWTVVIGSETSAEARIRELERFCPESVTGEPGFRPDGGEVEVILSTDILSEGQNLQQAQAVLSFDMPWNPQRVVQCNGRIIRLRSPHDTAYLYTLLPKQGDLDRLLNLEAKLQAKIMAANASVGMETPVLADVETESQVYADLSTFVERLSGGDATLMDEQGSSEETGSAFAGELFCSHLRRAVEEGEVSRLQGLPWGIGAAFVQRSPTLAEPAVFFACRTRMDERYWRVVSQSGQILYSVAAPLTEGGLANPILAKVDWVAVNPAGGLVVADNVYIQVNFTLGMLAQQIALGTIGLPDIQRPFVWPNVKVRDLFDSMYRGYPVGYLLFWQNGQSSNPRAIGTDAKQVTANLVIVDGQQRLTSLYAVFKGIPVVRSNFQPARIRIAFNPLKGSFEVTSAAILRDKAFIPDISVLWSGDADLFQIVNGYLDGLRSVREVTGEEVQAVQSAMVKLQGLSNFPFTALQLHADISEEAVAEVFVRINSQGKTLNQADFILTLMSVFWDEGRTDLEQFSRLSMAPSANGPSPYNHFIQPSPDQLLRVSVGLGFKRGRLQHVYSILRGKDLESGEFSEARRVEQFQKLKQSQAKVLGIQYWHDFMRCLHRAGYRSGRMVSSQNALLFAYIFYLIGRTELSISERELRPVIAQWFFMSALTGRYTNSPESALESDLAMLRDVTTDEEFLARLRNACAVSLTNDFWEVTLPNELATFAARSPSLFAYEASLVLLDAPALFSHFKVEQMMDPTLFAPRNALERHHLFPRGYLATLSITETRDTNQIANYAYVEWKDNANIADSAPVKYLPEQQQGFTQSQLAQMYRLHALPTGWELMDYQKFLAARRELMAQIIREGYEKLSQGAPVELPTLDLAELIVGGESDYVEFKSTLRVNLHTHERDSRMEHVILRTLAGFLNTSGGTLVVGVADDSTPVGLNVDGFENEDKMALHLANIVNSRMGPTGWIAMHANFEDYEDDRVLVVHCEKARSAVYVTDGNAQHFYIRTGPSTTELNLSQSEEYIRQRFH